MQTLRFTIAAAGIFLAAANASAQTAPLVVESGLPTARVSYADLDLTSPAGRLTLDRRVAHAAGDICLDKRHQSLAEFAVQRECYSAAMSKARVDIQGAVLRATNQLASQGAILVAAK